jgi:hypothetical protein
MYLRLSLDFILLAQEKDTAELGRCRDTILRNRKLSEETIEAKVRDYFKSS